MVTFAAAMSDLEGRGPGMLRALGSGLASIGLGVLALFPGIGQIANGAAAAKNAADLGALMLFDKRK